MAKYVVTIHIPIERTVWGDDEFEAITNAVNSNHDEICNAAGFFQKEIPYVETLIQDDTLYLGLGETCIQCKVEAKEIKDDE
jgi:hypothetical protein